MRRRRQWFQQLGQGLRPAADGSLLALGAGTDPGKSASVSSSDSASRVWASGRRSALRRAENIFFSQPCSRNWA
jgi:hypothetical protein